MSRRNRRAQAPPLPRPETRELTVARVQDKYSEYPSNGLTPVRLAAIFREADTGDVMRQMELFEEMEEHDPHLFSQLQTRKNAVTGLDFEITAFGDEPRDKEIAEFVEEQLNGIEGMEDIETDLLDAIGKGIAVSEIMWGYDSGRVVVREIKNRHQKRFFWDGVDDSFRCRTDETPSGILLPKNKFIIHKYKARSGHPARAGILRVVAWMYLFKNYDIKDWISFAEVYGLPFRLGKYAPGSSDEEKRALMQALIQLGADAAGIIPEGASIEFVTAEKTSSTDLYERLARYCDEQISKAILGQTLTSDSGGGSYAQSKTHNEVRHDLTVADCKALLNAPLRSLVVVIIQFDSDKPPPGFLGSDQSGAGSGEGVENEIAGLGDCGDKVRQQRDRLLCWVDHLIGMELPVGDEVVGPVSWEAELSLHRENDVLMGRGELRLTVSHAVLHLVPDDLAFDHETC